MADILLITECSGLNKRNCGWVFVYIFELYAIFSLLTQLFIFHKT